MTKEKTHALLGQTITQGFLQDWQDRWMKSLHKGGVEISSPNHMVMLGSCIAKQLLNINSVNGSYIAKLLSAQMNINLVNEMKNTTRELWVGQDISQPKHNAIDHLILGFIN